VRAARNRRAFVAGRRWQTGSYPTARGTLPARLPTGWSWSRQLRSPAKNAN